MQKKNSQFKWQRTILIFWKMWMHKLVPEGGSMTKHIIRGSGNTQLGRVTLSLMAQLLLIICLICSACVLWGTIHTLEDQKCLHHPPPQAPDTQPQQTGPYFSYHIINIVVISGEMINRTQNVFLFPQAPKQTDIIRRKTRAHRAPNI